MTNINRLVDIWVENITETDVIAIDHHPVSYKLIDHLSEKRENISVISFSTDIIAYLAKYTQFNIILPNAYVDKNLHSLIGENAIVTFNSYKIDYYFANVPFIKGNELYQHSYDIALLQSNLLERTAEPKLINIPSQLKESSNYFLVAQLNYFN
ncbi:hypothetical protein N9R04_02560 [Staphylococcus sp. SQ8-PEA]|uniref:DeoR-like transcriptional repressor C-terminal sensor domain-containing protein n=1 Tax=Staphylococcus marylandisciuri TaxID=2981529 RepID=A0ABT2QNQ0_9STAP|nr:hypothetical protein [Staphylococcus marylandisciuri]MCU5745603.1 hypothetical protein [Staphylococcus marylandisciuri]